MPDTRLELLMMLASRLEHLPVDSRWARRAGGLRGNILKVLEEADSGQAIFTTRLDVLIDRGFEILKAAAHEIPDIERTMNKSYHGAKFLMATRRSTKLNTMRAMLLSAPHTSLSLVELPIPIPGPGQVLLKVRACGLCHTDLHIVDGELKDPKLPLVLGHQIVAVVVDAGPGASRFHIGERVGVPWLGAADGTCPACQRDQENLCDHPTFTGYHVDGGFAEYTVADENYCFRLPDSYSDAEAAPLLCAGLIGYRSYRLAGGNIETLGIYGFGAAAHLIAQVAKYEGKRIYAFTRPGDVSAQQFALRHGADWAGDSTVHPPEKLDAALIFAPVGALVVEALKVTHKGGTVVCGGIHMSDIPSFPYSLLWEERVIRSVANLTRKDGEEFFALATRLSIKAEVHNFPLEAANQALALLRRGELTGAAVLDLQSPVGNNGSGTIQEETLSLG